ncbi:hypothetical protein DES40_1979 [Litorimonas taeanensis]|uniref:Uncharacterized protein n=1 Tax=Litorimonas taeanensis TaxID=568099 RepID=A0A420WE40_9PROT|nr:hypothetical protein [Litorimonas taeanensis]RKQ69180.1 hypothetical protein DES40_1979 [Litorimonas taeanensis]
MIYLFYAFLIGTALGVLSAYHTKAFLSALVSTLMVGGLVMRSVILVGASASGFIGSVNPFEIYFIGFMQLPFLLRLSFFLLPAFFFMGRFIAWGYLVFFKEEIYETDFERRERVKNAHGWTPEKDKKVSGKIQLRR